MAHSAEKLSAELIQFLSRELQDEIVSVKPLNKGWSDDQKYRLCTQSGRELLLRLTNIDEFPAKEDENNLLEGLSRALPELEMARPVKFGFMPTGRDEVIYQILTWCQGTELKEVIADLPIKRQYALGVEAAGMLRAMAEADTGFAAEDDDADWERDYKDRLQANIRLYRSGEVQIPMADKLLPVIKKRRRLLSGRPLLLMHNDFQTDNLILTPDGRLCAIDFQGLNFCDPYLALTGAMVSAEVSPAFACGELDAWFNGPAPADFWALNLFYLAAESINACCVAALLDDKARAAAEHSVELMAQWFKDFKSDVPSWYWQFKRP